jgi:lambda family phage minor tail protein L
MDIEQEIRQPVTSAFIALFQLNIVTAGVTTSYYYTPMTNNEVAVEWNGQTYLPFPISIEEISFSTDSAPGRPKLKIANVLPGKLFGTLASQYGDLVGSEIIYTRTLGNFLGPSSTVYIGQLTYVIARKTVHNRTQLVFELRLPTDKDRSYLPKRQMLKRDFPGLGIVKRLS